MTDVPTVDPVSQSAYDLDTEMSLLLPSSAPDPWGAAVHEAARILADRPRDTSGRMKADLCTLALLLYERTCRSGRQPHDVPVTELHESLAGSSRDREPRIVEEIDRALTATGHGTSLEPTPLRDIYAKVSNVYPEIGVVADEIEPPGPGPSAMRGAAVRLDAFLADYSEHARRQAAVPEVASDPLVIEADRIELVTANSIMPLRCLYGDHAQRVRVDGPRARGECERGHVRSLSPAHVRVAAARATGSRPSAAGTHRIERLLVVTEGLRHTDPHRLNVFLKQPPLVGRDDIMEEMLRHVDDQL